MLWHLRLWHPSFPYLKHLFPNPFKILDCISFHCETYHLSKHHRISYKLKPYCVSKLGNKMVCDFHKLIDDWKSEVENLFKDSYSMVDNEFQTKISILQIDNGTEYFNRCLRVFFQRKKHWTSIHMSKYPSTKLNCWKVNSPFTWSW